MSASQSLLTVANSHYQANLVDKIKLSCNAPHQRSTTVSLETTWNLLVLCNKGTKYVSDVICASVLL